MAPRLVTMVLLAFVACSEEGGPSGSPNLFPTEDHVLEPPIGETTVLEDGVELPAVEREILVTFASDAGGDAYRAVVAAVEARGAEAVGQIPDLDVLQVRTASNEDILALAQELQLVQGVLDAEPNYLAADLDAVCPGCPEGSPCDPDDFWWIGDVDALTAWQATLGDGTSVCLIEGPPRAPANNDYDPSRVSDITPAWVRAANGTATGSVHATAVLSLMIASGDDEGGMLGMDWRASALAFNARSSIVGGYPFLLIRAGLHECADRGAHVANLSLGCNTSEQVCRAQERRLRKTIARAASDGDTADGDMIIVKAAGNIQAASEERNRLFPEGTRPEYTTAWERRVVLVTAHASGADTPYYWSGSAMDISAPGVRVMVPTETGIAWGNGTSLAAPLVSGTMALMLAARQGTGEPTDAASLKTALLDAADVSNGTRFLNAGRAVAGQAVPPSDCPGSPDIAILSLRTEPCNPVSDAYVGLQATVQNIGGQATTPFTTNYYVDGALVESENFTLSLAPGQSRTTGTEYTFTSSGNHEYRFEVADLAGDTCTENNSMTTTVSVD